MNICHRILMTSPASQASNSSKPTRHRAFLPSVHNPLGISVPLCKKDRNILVIVAIRKAKENVNPDHRKTLIPKKKNPLEKGETCEL